MGKINIIICTNIHCQGSKINFLEIKEVLEKDGYEVVLHSNFCDEIKRGFYPSPFNNCKLPTVFAGCSPCVMEGKLKKLLNCPVEIVNIREQCAWIYNNVEEVNKTCQNKIFFGIKQVKYARIESQPENVLGKKLKGYISLMEKYGPNPFKM
ncbi:MAG: hypothetical protein AB1420_17825 [Bacillota bacterium]